MVAKRGLELDSMGPVLEALLKELEAAARDLSTHAVEESERRARTLAALSKVAESLSGLLRGQFGTDDQALAPIPAGTRVVLIDERVTKLSLAESERGLGLQWRAGPVGRDKFGQSYTALEAANAGRALRPWSPCHLRVARQAGGDIRISWVRRARWGGDSWEGLTPPLSEEAEIYQVSIFSSGILKRRLESATPEATYALSAQIDDLGGPAAALELEVMQLSNRAGAGISRSGLIAVN
jgi:hypothetical protein